MVLSKGLNTTKPLLLGQKCHLQWICVDSVFLSARFLSDPREREEVELELLVGVAQVSQQQKNTVLRQLAALLHVLDADIALKGLHGQSDIR